MRARVIDTRFSSPKRLHVCWDSNFVPGIYDSQDVPNK